MKTDKKLGIWMDHANAHLIELKSDGIEGENVDSPFTHEVKEQSLGKSEHLMHNKEQHEQSTYYKQIGEKIKSYDDVLLFGPTNAKTELLNLLHADHLFERIKIEVKQADKMTDNQEQAFVREYFSKR